MAVKRAAAVMLVYAVVLAGLGVLAYVAAPEGASAGTALYAGIGAGVLMAACGIAALLPGYGARTGGLYAGLALPLVFAAVFFWRGAIAYRASGAFRYIDQVLYVRAVADGSAEDTPEGRERFYVQQAYQEKLARQGPANTERFEDFAAKAQLGEAPVLDHDKSYLGRILFLLHAASVGTFVALLMLRPWAEPGLGVGRGGGRGPELDLDGDEKPIA